MKLTSLCFLIVLFLSHFAGNPGDLLGRPLSMFRDGSLRWFGFVLFALLLVVVGLMIATALRKQLPEYFAIFSLAGILLLLVAVTPSPDVFHLLCSLVLLVLLFGYFALVARRAGLVWFWLHLNVPLLLLAVTFCHSYGLWQKSLIVYFLLMTSIQHHLLSRGSAAENRIVLGPRRREAWLPPKRVVYSLSSGKSWHRRK